MFTPYSGKAVGGIVARKLLPAHPRVVEMGNQTYSISGTAIRGIEKTLKAARIREGSIDFAALAKLASAPAGKRPADPAAPPVADFFRALGFSSYTAIDLNDRFGSLVMDLNKNLKEEYGFTEQYDLVTNIGVSEHIFDQAAFFKNAHQLAKAGGLMLHILPCVNYVNHGFFNYQPIFFIDLAHANGYELLELGLVDRNDFVVDALHPNEVGMYFSNYLYLFGKENNGNLNVVALLRKSEDAPFAPPLQGKYQDDIASAELKAVYAEKGRSPIAVSRKGLFERTEGMDKRPLARQRRSIKRKLLAVLFSISVKVLGDSR